MVSDDETEDLKIVGGHLERKVEDLRESLKQGLDNGETIQQLIARVQRFLPNDVAS